MRYTLVIFLISFLLSITPTLAGIDGNFKPDIFGQKALSVDQGQSITIRLTDLYVIDWDDSYPQDFTLEISAGNNYTVSGHTVKSNNTFYGQLVVQVRVNDGKDNSDTYDLTITVKEVPNQSPVIIGQATLSTKQNQPLTLQLANLMVQDPDNSYPNDFSLSLGSGSNYTITGKTITPSSNYYGTLSVPVTVNDGLAESPVFYVSIQVLKVNQVPEITAQVPLRINEDETLQLQLSHLKVVDNDNTYPKEFVLSVQNGSGYAITDNNTIHPAPNFNGTLTVPVKVSDGTDESKTFNVLISVNSVNDAPQISMEQDALVYEMSAGVASPLTPNFEVMDVDDDTLAIAEIKFDAASYKPLYDQLLFANTLNIRGVFDAQAGILSLIGRAPVSEYKEAIRTIKYIYMIVANDTIDYNKSVYINMTDGKSISATVQRLITLRNTTVDLNIPTGFTPNGDNVNDTWSINPLKDSDGLINPVIRVYNRHGKMVYEATEFYNKWDGTFKGEFLPTDTYFYTIDLTLPFTKVKQNGLVTILR